LSLFNSNQHAPAKNQYLPSISLAKLLLLLLMFGATTTDSLAATYYATPTGAGNKDGLSWTNATPLSNALHFAVSGDMYYPNTNATNTDNSDNRQKPFPVKAGVEVYSSFTSVGQMTPGQRPALVPGVPGSTTLLGAKTIGAYPSAPITWLRFCDECGHYRQHGSQPTGVVCMHRPTIPAAKPARC
jgi:hypothetical protein